MVVQLVHIKVLMLLFAHAQCQQLRFKIVNCIHSKSEDLDPNYPAKKFELSANLSKYATKWPKNGPKRSKYDPKWPKYDPKWPNMALE